MHLEQTVLLHDLQKYSINFSKWILHGCYLLLLDDDFFADELSELLSFKLVYVFNDKNGYYVL
jgi:hypothetical protein